MTIFEFLKIYFSALTFFFVIDMVWLLAIARNFYREQLGDLFTKQIIWPAAIVFYLLFVAGIVLFAVSLAIEKNSLLIALFYGALFGLISYATYDLTNLATIKNWPLTMTIVDLTWGTILSSVVATSTYLLIKWFSLV